MALIINVLFARPMKTTHKCLSRKNSIMLEKLTNLLAGMELVKIFPVGPRLSKEYKAAGEEYFHIRKKANQLTAGLECVNCFIDLTGALAFLGLV